MANRCSKISKTEQKKYDAYQKVIMQNYGDYQLPADAEDRKTEFAERLKTQMEKKQMTPAALALASGASATTIRKLLKGEYNKVSLTHIYLFICGNIELYPTLSGRTCGYACGGLFSRHEEKGASSNYLCVYT